MDLTIVDDKIVKSVIKPRKRDTHKGDYANVCVIGGKRGMSGAVYLASVSALRSGAGLVTAFVPDCINDILEVKTTEVMTKAFDDINGGFASSAAPEIIKDASKRDIAVFGIGTGTGEGADAILYALATGYKKRVVIDADGLNVLSKNTELLKSFYLPPVLTPHKMEMARLTGKSIEDINKDPLKAAKEFSIQYNAYTVLKGSKTYICAPDGRCAVNEKCGNPGMATGGSGDVLSGITGALCANCDDAFYGACAAVYVHALAGDIAKEKFGETSLTAGDICDNIYAAIKAAVQ